MIDLYSRQIWYGSVHPSEHENLPPPLLKMEKKAKSVVVTQPYVTTLPDFIEICRAGALYIHLYSRNQQRPQSLYIIVKIHFGSKPTKNIAIALHCNLKAARRHISHSML